MPAEFVREAHEDRIVSTLLNPAAKADTLEVEAIPGPVAAKFTGLSAKTLDRHAAAGENVGRIKIGRRVLYHLPTLKAWLASKANNNPFQTQTH